jgi:hypothetical protein
VEFYCEELMSRVTRRGYKASSKYNKEGSSTRAASDNQGF